MLIDTRRFRPPLHIPPVLHKDALLMSFENKWHIRKTYKEIVGLRDIDHFSINIVSPNKEMSIISYSPHIIFNLFQDGTYIYNGSISPTYYEKLDFYTWEQCYDRLFYHQIKNSLQTQNGIEIGVVLVHRALGYNVLFSFASKNKNNQLLEDIASFTEDFFDMGFHCLNLIKSIYADYHYDNSILRIDKPCQFKPVCRVPNLRLVK